MTLLTSLFAIMSAGVGFFIAWHWQRAKYEKVLKVLGKNIRDSAGHT